MPHFSAVAFARAAFVSLFFLAACGGPSGDANFTERVKKAAEEEAYTGPAVWRIADEDTTVYLLGTVHTMRPNTRWQTDLITETVLASDAIYFEADTQSTGAQGSINRAVNELGLITDGSTLGDILPEDAEREVKETADLLGLSMVSIDNFRPWLAGAMLDDVHLEAQGFDRSLGVEKVLGRLAKDRAIPVRYLESGAYQIELIASVPDAGQIELLVQTAEQIEDDPKFLDRTISEWSVGDLFSLTKIFEEDAVFGKGQVVYNLMVRTRNANWSQKIEALIKDEPGTFLIAVGTGHLIGDDSLQSILAARGIQAERVNPLKTTP